MAKPDSAGPPLVDAAVCDELEEALRVRFRTAAADGKLLAEAGLMENLIQWIGLGGEAEVRAWTDGLLGNDGWRRALGQSGDTGFPVARDGRSGDARAANCSPARSRKGRRCQPHGRSALMRLRPLGPRPMQRE